MIYKLLATGDNYGALHRSQLKRLVLLGNMKQLVCILKHLVLVLLTDRLLCPTLVHLATTLPVEIIYNRKEVSKGFACAVCASHQHVFPIEDAMIDCLSLQLREVSVVVGA